MHFARSIEPTSPRRFGESVGVSSKITPAKLLRELGDAFRTPARTKDVSLAAISDLINRTSFDSGQTVQRIAKFLDKRAEKLKISDFRRSCLATSVSNQLGLLLKQNSIDSDFATLKKLRIEYLKSEASRTISCLESAQNCSTENPNLDLPVQIPLSQKSSGGALARFRNLFSKQPPTPPATLATPQINSRISPNYNVEVMTQFCIICANDPSSTEMILKYFELVDPTVEKSNFAFSTHLKILIETIESIALNEPYRLTSNNRDVDVRNNFVDTLCEKAIVWLKSRSLAEYPLLISVKSSLYNALQTIDNKRAFADQLGQALVEPAIKNQITPSSL